MLEVTVFCHVMYSLVGRYIYAKLYGVTTRRQKTLYLSFRCLFLKVIAFQESIKFPAFNGVLHVYYLFSK